MDKTNIDKLPREARVTDTVKIGIAGMTCDNCVRKVERALRALPGIKEVKVDRAQASTTWLSSPISNTKAASCAGRWARLPGWN